VALLVLATTNRKKVEELIELLAPLALEIKSLADYPSAAEVIEDGETFAANARKKAVEHAVRLGQWVLAEDSGLEADALAGAPGVHSARFSGAGATDGANNRLVLERLGDTPIERRTARYVCCIAVCDPSPRLRAESEGYCRGRILLEERGTAGFGYDPLFEIVEFHRTFGELGTRVKAAISHRARALSLLLPQLARLLDDEKGRLREG